MFGKASLILLPMLPNFVFLPGTTFADTAELFFSRTELLQLFQGMCLLKVTKLVTAEL